MENSQKPANPEAASQTPPQGIQAEAPQAAPEMSDLDKRFAALSRREKSLLQKERELKAMMEQIQGNQSRQELKKKDPLAWLQEEGIDFDSLTQSALKKIDGPSPDDKIKEIEEKIAAYEKMMRDKEEEDRSRTEQQAIDNFKREIESHVRGSAEKYELIHLDDAFELVFDVIEGHYNKTLKEFGEGETLPIEKAADQVEQALFDKYKKIREAKKFQEKKDPDGQPETPPGFSGTLSQSMTPASTAPTPRTGKVLDRETAIAEIAKAFANRAK